MLSYIVLYLKFLCVLKVADQAEIRSIYFDSATTLLPGNNGVVIIEFSNGTKSTICANSVNNTKVATVACRSMNYTGATSKLLSAVALISSKKTTLATTNIQNLNCNGTEESLENCTGFSYTSSVDFKCKNNNQDLNAYCLYQYNYTYETANNESCMYSGNISRSSNIFKNENGALIINSNGRNITFCGVRNKFGTNEAKLFCRILCQNDTYARILTGINTTGLAIGGFNNFSCPEKAESLSNCTNVYVTQSDMCTPRDNIGVRCDLEGLTTDDPPTVHCGRNFLTLMWNVTKDKGVLNDTISLLHLNSSCNLTSTTSNSLTFNLSVSLNDCNSPASGDTSSIFYNYTVKRTYRLVNNVVVKNDQLFTVTCYIPRNDTVVQGPFGIAAPIINGGSGTTSLDTTLFLFRDQNFSISVQSLISEPLGTTIFARVDLINSPNLIVLNLVNCWVTSGSINVTLISSRCPAYPGTEINPISDTRVSFNFKSFVIPGATFMTVICQTSKCGKNEVGCITKCQN